MHPENTGHTFLEDMFMRMKGAYITFWGIYMHFKKTIRKEHEQERTYITYKLYRLCTK